MSAAAAPKPKRKRSSRGLDQVRRIAKDNAKFLAAQVDREMSRAARLEARDRAYAAELAANGIQPERVEYRPDGSTVRTRGYCAGCASAPSRRAAVPTDAPLFAVRPGRREAAPCA